MPDPSTLIHTVITGTLPITQYMQMFTPPTPGPHAPGLFYTAITPTVQPAITYTFNYMNVMTNTAPVVAATIGMAWNSYVFQAYILVRLAMTAVLFVMAFIMRTIRVPVPTEPVISVGRGYGRRVDMHKLPKIPKL